jgi:hypothetical protein
MISSRSVRTPQQKFALYNVKHVIARWASQAFENRYVFRALRLLRCRSVPLDRSMKTVLTHPNAAHPRAAARLSNVPNTSRLSTFTTRSSSRTLGTVASTSQSGKRGPSAAGSA